MSGLKVNCEVFVCNKTETVLFKEIQKTGESNGRKDNYSGAAEVWKKAELILLLIKRWQLYQRKEKLLQKGGKCQNHQCFLWY